jgi:hypothetical protein
MLYYWCVQERFCSAFWLREKGVRCSGRRMHARAACLGATVNRTRRETLTEFDWDRSHVKCDRGQPPLALS